MQNDTARTQDLVEPLLLFSAFFLPGYVLQTSGFDPAALADVRFHLAYIVTAAPQTALVVYLAARGRDFARIRYGFRPLRLRTLGGSVLVAVAIMAASLPAAALDALFSWGGNPVLVGLRAGESRPIGAYVSFLAVSVVTGYREEVFFRSFLQARLERAGASRAAAAAVSAILFGIGHMYQGAPAFLSAVLIAASLSAIFLRYRSIHTLAIGHALYNILVYSLPIVAV